MSHKLKFSVNYQVIFSVELSHSYYNAGIARDLRIVPTAKTKEQLNRRRLSLVRTETNGIIILGEVRNLIQLYQGIKDDKAGRQAIEREKLVFRLENTNPHFFNFTDLGEVMGDEDLVLYYHNLREKDQLEQETIEIKNKRFQVAIDEEFKDKNLTVKNAFDQIVLEDEIKTQYGMINLKNEPTGKYTLQIANNQPSTFYTLDTMMSPLGIIELYFGKAFMDALELLQIQKIPFQAYQIHFEARETTWKYFLINRTENRYNSFQIKNEKDIDQEATIKFQKQGTVNLPNGQKAELMLANKSLPLREIPEDVWLLKMELKHKRGINFQIPLPNPSPTIIKPSEDHPNTMYSEIYVYL